MKQYAILESVALKYAALSIRPFMGPGANTGLKEYNMVIHENIVHTDCIVCHADGRTKTYLCGLNEKVPEIQNIQNDDEKQAKIKAIRILAAKAEREIAGNYSVNPDDPAILEDPQFWAKITMFRPVIADVFDNKGLRVDTYWDTFVLKLSNDGLILDGGSTKDLLLINAIEAGGFSMVAKSYEEALEHSGQYKFYLDKRQDTSAIKVVDRKIRDKAGAKLTTLSEKDSNKLFYITKIISTDSLFFKSGKNSTPLDVFYKECSDFIDGLTPAMDKVEACEAFIRYAGMSLEELKARCVYKDAMTLHFLTIKDQDVYHIKTGTILGKNVEEAVVFLLNAANVTVYTTLSEQCQKQWAI